MTKLYQAMKKLKCHSCANAELLAKEIIKLKSIIKLQDETIKRAIRILEKNQTHQASSILLLYLQHEKAHLFFDTISIMYDLPSPITM